MPDDGRPRRARLLVASEDEGRRLDLVLAARIPDLTRSQAQRLIREGRVTLSHGRPKPALPVPAGVEIVVDIPAAEPIVPAAESLPLRVLHEDDDLAVVDKPAGMVVHPSAGHRAGTLVNALLHHLRGLSGVGGSVRPGIVHRLDRGTSGLMVVAKTDRAHHALARQFQERSVRKEYLALIWGAVSAGDVLSKPIGRDPRNRKKMSTRARRARPAETRVLDVEKLGGVSLVRATIGTGRTHQIRVHFSESGHPVVGDEVYGGSRRSAPPRIAVVSTLERPFLHASRLAFTHPTDGRAMDFESPLPDDLARVLHTLRRAAGRRPENPEPRTPNPEP
jgi:23S rRNA pseudouridine1911/1915/1917 synthase